MGRSPYTPERKDMVSQEYLDGKAPLFECTFAYFPCVRKVSPCRRSETSLPLHIAVNRSGQEFACISGCVRSKVYALALRTAHKTLDAVREKVIQSGLNTVREGRNGRKY